MKMNKMIIAGILAALMLATAACSSGNTTTAAETPAPTETEPVVTTEAQKVGDVLPFLKDGEIYVEVKLSTSAKNAAVSLDGTKLDGNKAAFKPGTNLELTGEFTDGASVDAIIIVSKGSESKENASVEYKKGVDVEMIATMISRSLARDTAAKKAFVSIVEKDQSWDKSLSEEMNAFIKSMYPVAP